MFCVLLQCSFEIYNKIVLMTVRTSLPVDWKLLWMCPNWNLQVYICHDLDTGRELAVKQVEIGHINSATQKVSGCYFFC